MHHGSEAQGKARLQRLEETVAFQEQTIDDLNGVVLELRRDLERFEERLERALALLPTNQAQGGGAEGERGTGSLPPRPGTDPEAPPHY